MGSTIATPEWFEQALAMKAKGKTVRQIAGELNVLGFEVSRNAVWLHLWPKGREKLRRIQDPEYKQAAAGYSRAWRKARKRFEHAD